MARMELATGPRDAATAALPPLDPHVIVLFGATGDLAKGASCSWALPPLRGRADARVQADRHRPRGARRGRLRPGARAAVEKFARCPVTKKELDRFISRLRYVSPSAGPTGLATAVASAEAELGALRVACTT